MKISDYSDRDFWKWGDSFTTGNNLAKQVNGGSLEDIINVCIINFKDVREDCDSDTFNNNGKVEKSRFLIVS